MNVYDVLRTLVRGQGHGSPQQLQDLLLTVDAAEQGYADVESYREVLAQKAREEAAALQATVSAPSEPADVTAGLSDAQLQAEIDRRAALTTATSTGQHQGLTRPAAIPTS